LYPWFEGITNASFLGNIRIFNSLGVSQGLFAFALIAVAVGAFIMTTMIEKKVDPNGPAKSFDPMLHRLGGHRRADRRCSRCCSCRITKSG
jgi:hypothetical protein